MSYPEMTGIPIEELRGEPLKEEEYEEDDEVWNKYGEPLTVAEIKELLSEWFK